MHPEITSLEQINRERERFDQLRRTIFIVAGLLGLAIIAYDTNDMLHQPTPSTWLVLGNNVFFGLFAAAMAGLAMAGRVPQEVLERVTLGVFALESLLFNGLVPGIMNPSIAFIYRETLSDDIWFLLIICIMILHMFPLRQALWLASGMYLLSAMVLVWRVTRAAPANQPEAIPIIVRTYLFGALLVLLCYLLVRYRDNLRRLRHQHDLLERMAFVDALTEVHNRRYVDHQLREQISLVRRYQQPLSVLLCDIDHFKQINDHLGHSGGDRVLVEVARLLRAHVRGADIVGRWGGEEFIVVMHMTDVEGALTVAERMRVAVEQSPVVAGRSVTVSIGVSTYEPGDTFDSLLHRADDALYRAKRAGRNRVTVAAQQLA